MSPSVPPPPPPAPLTLPQSPISPPLDCGAYAVFAQQICSQLCTDLWWAQGLSLASAISTWRRWGCGPDRQRWSCEAQTAALTERKSWLRKFQCKGVCSQPLKHLLTNFWVAETHLLKKFWVAQMHLLKKSWVNSLLKTKINCSIPFLILVYQRVYHTISVKVCHGSGDTSLSFPQLSSSFWPFVLVIQLITRNSDPCKTCNCQHTREPVSAWKMSHKHNNKGPSCLR